MAGQTCQVSAPTFSLPVEKAGGLVVDVFLWPDIPALGAGLIAEWEMVPEEALLLSGICFGVTHSNRPEVVACVHLPEEEMGAGLVAHEMGHAALRIMDRLGHREISNGWRGRTDQSVLENRDTPEELFCHVLETLNREFWSAYADRTEPAADAEA